MFKVYIKSRKAGVNNLLVLGLTKENVDLLRQDKPIVFNCRQQGMDFDALVMVMYDSPTFRQNQESLRSKLRKGMYPFVLDDEAFEKLKNGAHILFKEDIDFMFLYVADPKVFHREVMKLVGPETKVKLDGWSPTDRAMMIGDN